MKRLIFQFLFVLSIFTLSFPVRADEQTKDSPFGMLAFLDWNHSWNANMYDSPAKISKAVKLMKEAGVSIVRQVISWDDVEPRKGEFHFDKYDTLLKDLEDNGIEQLAVLCYNATWTGKVWNEAPDTAAFVNYVRTTVRRYKGRIHYWELWNEPDQRTYWTNQDGMKTYVALLKAVYPVIKQEDPAAKVLIGSANTPFPLRDSYRAGAKDYFDIVNIHPFVSPVYPNAIGKVKGIYASVRKIQAEFGDADKPLWFTELGCPGVEDVNKQLGWWEGKSPDEAGQAEWVRQIYTEAIQWPGLEKIFWAFFQETNHFNTDVDQFGLVRPDFSLKPAYKEYQKAAHAWKDSH